MPPKVTKKMTVTILEPHYIRTDWAIDFDGTDFSGFFKGLQREMKKLGIEVSLIRNREHSLDITSYADMLNLIKVASPDDGHGNQCVGHILGKSEHLDLQEDIRIAVRRLAFAPETVAPDNEFRKVCHNCGCGC